jgi:hypothetical protein
MARKSPRRAKPTQPPKAEPPYQEIDFPEADGKARVQSFEQWTAEQIRGIERAKAAIAAEQARLAAIPPLRLSEPCSDTDDPPSPPPPPVMRPSASQLRTWLVEVAAKHFPREPDELRNAYARRLRPEAQKDGIDTTWESIAATIRRLRDDGIDIG